MRNVPLLIENYKFETHREMWHCFDFLSNLQSPPGQKLIRIEISTKHLVLNQVVGYPEATERFIYQCAPDSLNLAFVQ